MSCIKKMEHFLPPRVNCTLSSRKFLYEQKIALLVNSIAFAVFLSCHIAFLISVHASPVLYTSLLFPLAAFLVNYYIILKSADFSFKIGRINTGRSDSADFLPKQEERIIPSTDVLESNLSTPDTVSNGEPTNVSLSVYPSSSPHTVHPSNSPQVDFCLSQEQNKELIKLVPSCLRYEKEFSFLFPDLGQQEKFFNSQALKARVEKDLHTASMDLIHYYPRALIKKSINCLFHHQKSFQEKQKTFFLLLPFFIGIYKSTPDRENKLVEMIKKLVQEGLYENSHKQAVNEHLERSLSLLSPFFVLVNEKNWKGKSFFLQSLYTLIFLGLPNLLATASNVNKEESLRKRNRRILFEKFHEQIEQSDAPIRQKLLEACEKYQLRLKNKKARVDHFHFLVQLTFPHLAAFVTQPHLEEFPVKEYIECILSSSPSHLIHQIPESIQAISTTPQDLFDFVHTLDSGYYAFKEKISAYLDALLEYPEPTEKERKKVETFRACIEAFKKIRDPILVEIEELMEGIAPSPGLFFAKSYLLTKQIWSTFNTQQVQMHTARRWVAYFKFYLQKAEIECDHFEEDALQLIHFVLAKLQPKDQFEFLSFVPIHEGILLLLFVLKNINCISTLRLFFKEHLLQSVLLLLEDQNFFIKIILKDKNSQKLFSRYKNLVAFSGKAALSMLKVFTDWMSEEDGNSINTFFNRMLFKPLKVKTAQLLIKNFFKNLIDSEQSEDKKIFFKAIQPLALFMIRGVLKDESQQQSFEECIQNMKNFYKKIYSFEFLECLNKPERLNRHILESLESILSPKRQF